ncbi:MAG: hypothetical protein K2X74_17770 [Acetobacteraceae bacterium]|nr:hypothetical protein [Acetobacteraceae bacterium]
MRRALRNLAVMGIALGLAACAQPPEAIAPVAVSPLKYQGANCRTLVAQVAYMDRELVDLSARQRSNHLNDISSTLLLLHPRATVVGPDLAPAIALTRGERDAANAVLQARC